MEWCFEKCDLAFYHPDKKTVSTAPYPHCSAAVLYTNIGETWEQKSPCRPTCLCWYTRNLPKGLRFDIFWRSAQATSTASACIGCHRFVHGRNIDERKGRQTPCWQKDALGATSTAISCASRCMHRYINRTLHKHSDTTTHRLPTTRTPPPTILNILQFIKVQDSIWEEAQDLHWGSSLDTSKNETKYKYHALDWQRRLCSETVSLDLTWTGRAT